MMTRSPHEEGVNALTLGRDRKAASRDPTHPGHPLLFDGDEESEAPDDFAMVMGTILAAVGAGGLVVLAVPARFDPVQAALLALLAAVVAGGLIVGMTSTRRASVQRRNERRARTGLPRRACSPPLVSIARRTCKRSPNGRRGGALLGEDACRSQQRDEDPHQTLAGDQS